MGELTGKVAVVTGAGSGIGRAVSLRLAAEGSTVWLVGRNETRLAAVVQSAVELTGHCISCPADITVDRDVETLKERIEHEGGGVDILVHSAGAIVLGRLAETAVEDLDHQYTLNVRAPYILTRAFLPLLRARGGQIVFMNSSLGLTTRPEVGQYAATKHASKAFADTLRQEINAAGVRVLSMFLGRTATPMQAEVHRIEHRPYRPEHLIQPEDVATILVSALILPRTAEVTEISMRPMQAGS